MQVDIQILILTLAAVGGLLTFISYTLVEPDLLTFDPFKSIQINKIDDIKDNKFENFKNTLLAIDYEERIAIIKKLQDLAVKIVLAVLWVIVWVFYIYLSLNDEEIIVKVAVGGINAFFPYLFSTIKFVSVYKLKKIKNKLN